MLRVVSLLPSATEIVCAIGASHLLVGRSHECDYPASITRLPILTGQKTHFTSSKQVDAEVRQALATGNDLYTLNTTLLEELRPNVILTQSLCDVCSVYVSVVLKAAKKMSPEPKVIALNPHSLSDVLDDVLTVGEVLGVKESAQQTYDRLQQRINAVQRSAMTSRQKPLTVVCLDWLEPLFVSGHTTPEIIKLAGGNNPLIEAGQKSKSIPPSLLSSLDPDALIVSPCGLPLPLAQEEIEKTLGKVEWWRNLTAVKNGNVALVDGNLMINRLGPRLVDFLEWMNLWLNVVEGGSKILSDEESAFLNQFPWKVYTPSSSSSSSSSASSSSQRKEEVKKESEEVVEQRRRHDEAVANKKATYIDPKSGFQVMTEQYLRDRGWCCGNGCRHCPYGHWNVTRATVQKSAPKQPILLSLDKQRQKILNNAQAASANEEAKKPCSVLVWNGSPASLIALDRLESTDSRPLLLLSTIESDQPFTPLATEARWLKKDILVVPLPSKCAVGEFVSAMQTVLSTHPSLSFREHCNIVFPDLHIQELKEWKEQNFASLSPSKCSLQFPLFGENMDQLETELSSLLKKYKMQVVVDGVGQSDDVQAALKAGTVFSENVKQIVKSLPSKPHVWGENGEFSLRLRPQEENGAAGGGGAAPSFVDEW